MFSEKGFFDLAYIFIGIHFFDKWTDFRVRYHERGLAVGFIIDEFLEFNILENQLHPDTTEHRELHHLLQKSSLPLTEGDLKY